jgi:hypothetical protein
MSGAPVLSYRFRLLLTLARALGSAQWENNAKVPRDRKNSVL